MLRPNHQVGGDGEIGIQEADQGARGEAEGQ